MYFNDTKIDEQIIEKMRLLDFYKLFFLRRNFLLRNFDVDSNYKDGPIPIFTDIRYIG